VFDPANVGEEVFGTLRSFDYAVVLFDEDGNETPEPTEARRFFTDKRNITVSIYEDGENSALHVYLGRSVDVEAVQGMLDTLRRCATKFGIMFNCRKYRRELEPKDFANGSTVLESRKLTGSSKSSYLKLEGARMILRHDTAIDDKKHGARARNVKKVMIENNQGERFLMPTQNLMAGRAMTRHVSKGGQFHDDVGTKITEMATSQQQMKTCASYCRKNKKLDESVSEIIEACTDRAKHIRNVFEGLYRRYDKTLNEINKETDNLLLEDDDELLEEKTDALMKKLQLEDESVVDRQTCKNVVRVMEGRPKKVEMGYLEALDCEVEKQAWADFVSEPGSINFIRDTAPDVSPAGKNLAAGLSLVAKQCADDAFSNALAKVSQMMENGDDSVLLKRIAHHAMQIASAHSNKSEAQPLVKTPSKDMERVPESKASLKNGVIMTESVRELEAWFESFDEDKIFAEAHGDFDDGDVEYTTALDNAFQTVEDEFNLDDYLVMSGDDFGYGDSTLSAEDKVTDVTEIMSSLSNYLSNEISSELMKDIETDEMNDTSSLNSLSKRLIGQVISKLEEEGYTVTGQETLEDDDADDLAVDAEDSIKFDDRMIEDDDDDAASDVADGLDDEKEILLSDDLSAEDVIMPTDPTTDLKREIAADTDETDADYINRLLTLAGRKSEMAPKAPQP
jgi:hypothetical protein